MKYYLIAGEASGDLHGSNLMRAIAGHDGDAEFRFFGGDMMRKAGGTCVRHYRELAYMGIWPVLTHLGTILRSVRLCYEDISEWKPDAVILIDYPGFNLSIAKMVRKNLGIPVYYYISPKLWAWKGYRIRNIRRDVTRLFSILPFEVDYYRKRGYEAEYVGNPCADAIGTFRQGSDTVRPNAAGKRVIAILAGSRKQEINRNLPRMLQAVRGIGECDVVIAAAPGIEKSFYDKFDIKNNVRIIHDNTYAVLEQSCAALVTSGTATLETALLRVPQVVCYHLPVHLLALLFRTFFLKVKYVSLVNLIAGRKVVPELLGGHMNPANVRDCLLPLLHDTPQRRAQFTGYDDVIEKLGPAGASEKVADRIVSLLKEKQ